LAFLVFYYSVFGVTLTFQFSLLYHSQNKFRSSFSFLFPKVQNFSSQRTDRGWLVPGGHQQVYMCANSFVAFWLDFFCNFWGKLVQGCVRRQPYIQFVERSFTMVAKVPWYELSLA
jgi:hypothetical protein